MPDELLLGITILSRGGTTNIPKTVREVLKFSPTPQKGEKMLWTENGDEVIVTKGTPQSSFRKTMLRRNGTAAVPRHIREMLKLKPTLDKEERMLWIRKGDDVVVRKGTPKSTEEEDSEGRRVRLRRNRKSANPKGLKTGRTSGLARRRAVKDRTIGR